MPRVCEICGKGSIKGHNISHSHKVSNRRYKPNLQTIKVIRNGKVRRITVCTKCLKSGKVQRVE